MHIHCPASVAVYRPMDRLMLAAGSSFALWESTVPYTEKSIGLFLNGTLRRPVLVRRAPQRLTAAGM